MNVVSSPDELDLEDCLICIGNFDGVHLGHQLLLERMRTLAQAHGKPSVVITFFPPAKVIFAGESYLSSPSEKLLLLRPFSPDAVAMIPFSRDYAMTDKETFISQLRRLAPHTIIVGEDFRFGHHRVGGLDDLQHVTHKLEVFGMRRLDGEPIHSSSIRELLQHGDTAEVTRLSGHPYLAQGEVSQGDRRGRELGYPTANLQLPPQKALPIGVFAVTVDTLYGAYGGMASTGARPNFPANTPSLEVNLFDFKNDLYGQTITVYFHHFLREQLKFDGLEALTAQLAEDGRRARALLAGTR